MFDDKQHTSEIIFTFNEQYVTCTIIFARKDARTSFLMAAENQGILVDLWINFYVAMFPHMTGLTYLESTILQPFLLRYKEYYPIWSRCFRGKNTYPNHTRLDVRRHPMPHHDIFSKTRSIRSVICIVCLLYCLFLRLERLNNNTRSEYLTRDFHPILHIREQLAR